MVNVQFLAQFFLGNAAMPALVMVALAGLAALAFPVWAVVGKMSTFPYRAILSSHVFRHPLAATFQAAKNVISSLYLARIFLYFFATDKTSKLNLDGFGVLGSPFSHALAATKILFAFLNKTGTASKTYPTVITFNFNSYTSPFIVTFFATEMVFASLYLIWLLNKYFFAIVTFDFFGFQIGMILAAIVFGAPLALAFGTTKLMTTSSQAIRVSEKFFTAGGTFHSNHFPLQKGATPGQSGSVATDNRAEGDMRGLKTNPLFSCPWQLDYIMNWCKYA